MTCRGHVRAATRLARRRGVPYGSPRRSKVRSAQNPAALLELPDSSSALPCSSFPNRTHFVGLRFGCFFILKISRVFHDVASNASLATTFYALHQKSSRAHSAAPPFRIKPTSLGFDSVLCPQNWLTLPFERDPLFEHFYRKAGLFLLSKP